MIIKFKRTILLKINLALIIVFYFLWVVPLPFSISHHLIVDNYDFYTQNKSEWAEGKSILNRIYVNGLDLKLRHDWKKYILKRTDLLDYSDLEKGKFAVNVTKSLFADIPHIPVSQSLFGSIVHGYGHCDELNGAVAYLMHGQVNKSDLFALWDKENSRSQHSVARIESDEFGVFYLDAYKKNVPFFGIKEYMTIEGQDNLPEYVDVSGDLGLSKNLYLDGRTLSSYNFGYQLNKALSRIYLIFKNDLYAKNVSDYVGGIFGIRGALANNINNKNFSTDRDILKIYISARVHHIYGRLKEAKNLYSMVNKSKCILNECLASEKFYKSL